MSGRQQRSRESVADSLPIKEGGVVGAAAYVVGLAVTFVLFQLDSDLQDGLMTAEFEELGVGTLDAVVWVFHAGHFVDLEVSGSGAGQGGGGSFDLFSRISTSLPDLVYHLVPIVVLLSAGYLLLQWVEAASGGEAAKFGATVLVGYLPLAAVMPFVFRLNESRDFGGGSVSLTVTPDVTTSILLAGILFPAGLGAAGGYVWFTREGSGAAGPGSAQQPPAGQQPPGADPTQPRQGQGGAHSRQGGGRESEGRQGGRQRRRGDDRQSRPEGDPEEGDQRRGRRSEGTRPGQDQQDR